MWYATYSPTRSSPASSCAAARARSTSVTRAGSLRSDCCTFIGSDCAPPGGRARDWSCKAGRVRALLAAATVLLLAACSASPTESAPATRAAAALRVDVLQRIPHDVKAFTQGFELVDGVL